MDIDWSLIIAGYGAFLSTLLAIPSLREAWSNRFQIDVSYVFRGDPGVGNVVHIRNLSGKPIILEYFELSCIEGFWPKRKIRYFESPEDELLNLRIEPAGNEVLNFSEGYHFPWGKGKRVYIKLYFVGKKPVVKRLGK